MKNLAKLLKIGFGIFASIILFLFVANYIWLKIYVPTIATDPVSSVSVSGESMTPTFTDGQLLKIDSSITPHENDVISFTCFSKCREPWDNSTESFDLIKRIIKTDGDKIWVEGDNKERSYDSRYYGWLSPSDIKIDGVVIQ